MSFENETLVEMGRETRQGIREKVGSIRPKNATERVLATNVDELSETSQGGTIYLFLLRRFAGFCFEYINMGVNYCSSYVSFSLYSCVSPFLTLFFAVL